MAEVQQAVAKGTMTHHLTGDIASVLSEAQQLPRCLLFAANLRPYVMMNKHAGQDGKQLRHVTDLPTQLVRPRERLPRFVGSQNITVNCRRSASDDAAAMFLDLGVAELAADRPQRTEGAFFRPYP
jgi:hypothetical protein